jgi:hypothetical protein
MSQPLCRFPSIQPYSVPIQPACLPFHRSLTASLQSFLELDRQRQRERQRPIRHRHLIPSLQNLPNSLLQIRLGSFVQLFRSLEEQGALWARERWFLDLPVDERSEGKVETQRRETYMSCRSVNISMTRSSLVSFATSNSIDSPPQTGHSGLFSCSNVNV